MVTSRPHSFYFLLALPSLLCTRSSFCPSHFFTASLSSVLTLSYAVSLALLFLSVFSVVCLFTSSANFLIFLYTVFPFVLFTLCLVPLFFSVPPSPLLYTLSHVTIFVLFPFLFLFLSPSCFYSAFRSYFLLLLFPFVLLLSFLPFLFLLISTPYCSTYCYLAPPFLSLTIPISLLFSHLLFLAFVLFLSSVFCFLFLISPLSSFSLATILFLSSLLSTLFYLLLLFTSILHSFLSLPSFLLTSTLLALFRLPFSSTFLIHIVPVSCSCFFPPYFFLLRFRVVLYLMLSTLLAFCYIMLFCFLSLIISLLYSPLLVVLFLFVLFILCPLILVKTLSLCFLAYLFSLVHSFLIFVLLHFYLFSSLLSHPLLILFHVCLFSSVCFSFLRHHFSLSFCYVSRISFLICTVYLLYFVSFLRYSCLLLCFARTAFFFIGFYPFLVATLNQHHSY